MKNPLTLLFTPVLLIFFLSAFPSEAIGQNIAKQWKNDKENIEWNFSDNSMGKRFRYTKDTLLLSGTWSQKGQIITLDYPINGMPIDSFIASKTPPKPPVKRDSLGNVIPSPPVPAPKITLPIPRQLTIQNATEDALSMSGDGQTYQMSYDRPSALGSLFNNGWLRGLIGILGLLFITFLFSTNRRAINWIQVASGIGLQLLFAFLILYAPKVHASFGLFKSFFDWISGFFIRVLDFTMAGSKFLFSGLVADTSTFGYIFAFQVLPTIIFFSALSSMLYYLGILQKIVYGFAFVMNKLMQLSGAESVAAAANIFIGQTEAPLAVKPYLEKMTRSEIMCLMTGGMATVAGGVFVAYISMLGGTDEAMQRFFASHLLAASIMSAPAAIVAAKMLVPETNYDQLDTNVEVPKQEVGSNLLEAISNGTTEGLKLAVNVGAMLLAFYALVDMMDYLCLNVLGYYTGLNAYVAEWSGGRYPGLNLASIFGTVFAPLAWLIGVPTVDISSIGQLLGEKMLLNEFVAYGTMGKMKAAGILMEEKSLVIATYALCGFANFASIGIQIGGIGSIAPGQRKTLAEFGLLSLVGGTVACLLTAVIAGMLIG